MLYTAAMQSWRGVVTVILVGCGGTTSRSSDDIVVPNAILSSQDAEQERSEDFRISLTPMVLTQSAWALKPGNTEPGHTSIHMAEIVNSHRLELRSCTEDSVGGSLNLYLEIGEQGGVVGGSTDPAPGQDGVSAVAACILRVARDWRFPKRSVRGSTILSVPFLWNDGHSEQ